MNRLQIYRFYSAPFYYSKENRLQRFLFREKEFKGQVCIDSINIRNERKNWTITVMNSKIIRRHK